MLQDINLTVGKGEVVVVLGPSGSGKSTLCRAINRLETIESGIDQHRRQGSARRGQAARPPAGRRRHGVPVLQPLLAQDDSRQHDARADQGAQEVEERGQHPGRRPARAGRRLGPGREVPRPALRRAAAARGDRAFARHGSQGHALRRAHLGPRPRDGQRGARRHGRPGQGGHDDDRRHPRDGLRPQGRRPGRLHVRRPDRRGRHSRGVLHRAQERAGPRTSSARSSPTEAARTLHRNHPTAGSGTHTACREQPLMEEHR